MYLRRRFVLPPFKVAQLHSASLTSIFRLDRVLGDRYWSVIRLTSRVKRDLNVATFVDPSVCFLSLSFSVRRKAKAPPAQCTDVVSLKISLSRTCENEPRSGDVTTGSKDSTIFIRGSFRSLIDEHIVSPQRSCVFLFCFLFPSTFSLLRPLTPWEPCCVRGSFDTPVLNLREREREGERREPVQELELVAYSFLSEIASVPFHLRSTSHA